MSDSDSKEDYFEQSSDEWIDMINDQSFLDQSECQQEHLLVGSIGMMGIGLDISSVFIVMVSKQTAFVIA